MRDLELRGLSKSFGIVRALDDCSLTVHEGEIYGFVGSNGAGKTTAMRIALGVLAADAGEVLFDGRPLDHAARARVGYMPEERGLYPRMRVGPQLTYLAELHGLDSAAARDAMLQWTDRLGIGGRRGDEVMKLSLGNQQRVQLAAALVHHPSILVLDEPFSGLDPVAVDVMSQVLRDQAAAGVPVIFSSHQLDLVERLCDRVGIIQRGRMVAEGTIEELRTTDRQRLLARVDGVRHATWAAVPGVTVVSTEQTDDGVAVVGEIVTGDVAAEQALLRAATAAGAVREFAPVRLRLADLFRHVVTSEEMAA
ncbi:MAG: ABC transporter ATP-binding protein [Actinomycetales bacterium]|nr:ABC transporter ATP-binding protein [Actinomycetales bacterium]